MAAAATGHRDAAQKVAELLETGGRSPAQASRRPLAFSGGERQRVGIARALAVSPDIVIADEPLSALDVSIQAQVLNLMIRLQEERGLTYLFVTHDLDVARHISQRTAVLYLGRVVEYAPTTSIFDQPLHPYTQGLIRSIPRLDTTSGRKRRLEAIGGTVPSLLDPPPGCRFQPTCSVYALDAIAVHGAGRGTILAVRRLARCHPISWLGGSSGFDPVPPAKSQHS